MMSSLSWPMRRSAPMDSHANLTEKWNKNPGPFVWAKSADDIMETLADYCRRVAGAGRHASGRPADPAG
jgi:hypothetical protein